MDKMLHENKTFEQIDYTEKRLSGQEFTSCVFTNCLFQKADLSHNDFIDCSFSNCNLSLAVLGNTGLKNALFRDCKLVGIDFSRCAGFLFSVEFRSCHLDYASFFGRKMKQTAFSACSLKEVNFEEADLSGASFTDCDLQGATFVKSILEKADFRSAENYAFDPERNRVRGARFSLPAVAGLLAKYNIRIEPV